LLWEKCTHCEKLLEALGFEQSQPIPVGRGKPHVFQRLANLMFSMHLMHSMKCYTQKNLEVRVNAYLLVPDSTLLRDRDGRKDIRVMQPSTLEFFIAEIVSLLNEGDYANVVFSEGHRHGYDF